MYLLSLALPLLLVAALPVLRVGQELDKRGEDDGSCLRLWRSSALPPSIPPVPAPAPFLRPFSSRFLPLLPACLVRFLPPVSSVVTRGLLLLCALLCSAVPPRRRRMRNEENGRGKERRGMTETRVASLGLALKRSPSVTSLCACCPCAATRDEEEQKKGKPPTRQRTPHNTGGQEAHTKGCNIDSSTQCCRRHGRAPLPHEASLCPFVPPLVWPFGLATEQRTEASHSAVKTARGFAP